MIQEIRVVQIHRRPTRPKIRVGLVLHVLHGSGAYAVQSTGRTRSSSLVTLARPSVSSSLQVTNRSFTYMHHLTCGISSLLHSVNIILFTVILVHLILHISPHHSHHLYSHYLSLPIHFTPDLKLISFTNPFLHSHSYPFRTDFTDLNLY